METKTIVILIALNACHTVADYTWLSRPWMLSAKRFGTPMGPILLHSMIHAVLMGCVLMPFVSEPLWMFLVSIQLVTHFGIDVIKGKLNLWFPMFQNTTSYYHWTLFGSDQFCHQLVIILLTYLACK